MNETVSAMQKSDKWIPWLFVLFFVVIALVDGTFVTIAIRTQTGLVTDQAYERGLAYNKILDEAAAQEKIYVIQKAMFKNTVLSWQLTTKDGLSIDNAIVTAKIFRPVQDGRDFEITLDSKDNGLYKAHPQFPLKGLWTARLEAQWKTLQSKDLRYKTTLDLIAE